MIINESKDINTPSREENYKTAMDEPTGTKGQTTI
jgi:hypothetical protein